MRNSPALILVSIVLALTAVSSIAEGSMCEIHSREPDHYKAFVKIDANTGAVTGTTTFQKEQQIQIIFENKNPFKYSYRFQIVSTPTESAIVSAFFAHFPLDASGVQQLTMSGVASIEAVEPPWLPPIRELNGVVSARMTELKAFDAAYTKFADETKGDSINPSAVCQDAEALLKGLPRIIDVADTKAQFQKLSDLIDEPKDPLPTDEQKKELDKAAKNRDQFKTELDKLATNHDAYEHMLKIIQSAMSQNGPFFEVHYAQDTGGPTTTQVRIFRRDLWADNASEIEVGTVEITTGKSRFSLSAGFGISTMNQRKVVRQVGVEADTSTVATSQVVFGYEEDGDYTARFVVQANAVFLRRDDWGLATSLGIVPGSASLSDLEYIIGLSGAFIGERMFFTAALHMAKEESLAGGFKLGDPVPADLSDPLPIETSYEPEFMLSLTYRFK